jgi:hypothetical protein
MNVIGHEAVRGEFEALLGPSTQKLRAYELDGFAASERADPCNSDDFFRLKG